jgi:hypothetical protein
MKFFCSNLAAMLLTMVKTKGFIEPKGSMWVGFFLIPVKRPYVQLSSPKKTL